MRKTSPAALRRGPVRQPRGSSATMTLYSSPSFTLIPSLLVELRHPPLDGLHLGGVGVDDGRGAVEERAVAEGADALRLPLLDRGRGRRRQSMSRSV